MDSSNISEAPHILSAEAVATLGEGISLVFSRWTVLQMAIKGQWGGHESRGNADQLAVSIQSWFTQTKRECELIQRLRQLTPQRNAVSQSIQVANDDDDESSDQEGSRVN